MKVTMSHATFLDKINPFLKKANYLVSCLLLVLLFFVLMTHLNKEVKDLDIWLHLKTGEQIALNREIPLNDSFSFTKEGQPWINHEWLFQLFSYSFYSQFGSDGLILMQNIVFMAIFLMLLAMGLRNSNYLFVTTALYFLLLNTSYRFTIRPDMFSALFLVIYIYILKDKKKYFNLLPLLQVLWTNFHGFFFLGPVVILIFCLTQKKKKLMSIFLLSLAATLINPQLLKGAIYPLTTIIGIFKDRFAFGYIQELRNPLTLKTIFNLRSWPFFKALIFISLFSFRFNQKKFNLTFFLLWLLSLLLSLWLLRNIFYFAFIATIIIFYNTNQRVNSDENLSNEMFTKNRYYYIGRFSLIFVFAFFMIQNSRMNLDCSYYNFDKNDFKSCLWGESRKNFPKKAVDFIINENLPPRLFNDFNSGSYLIGRTYPKRKVFIDGRTEFYGDEFLKIYSDAADGDKETIQKLINKYDLDGFFLTMALSNFDEKLAKYLLDDPQWKAVYFDEKALIFLKDTPENQRIIRKFHIGLKSWRAPKEEIGEILPRAIFPYKNIKRGMALKEMGCYRAAISEAETALKIMPDTIEAFDILGNCYIELEEYDLALENLRIAVAIAPKAIGLRSKFALSLYKMGYIKEAESHLYKLIKSRPKNPENYLALAKVYMKTGELRKSENMASKASRFSDNKNIEILKLWAHVLFELKELKESLNIYKIAQQLQPEDSKVMESIKKIEKIL
ncbi:tetratricopeptide repeat protein [Candidatus Omnitrophota bacterium]